MFTVSSACFQIILPFFPVHETSLVHYRKYFQYRNWSTSSTEHDKKFDNLGPGLFKIPACHASILTITILSIGTERSGQMMKTQIILLLNMSRLSEAYTVCHIRCIYQVHYCTVLPNFYIFWRIRISLLGVPIFRFSISW